MTYSILLMTPFVIVVVAYFLADSIADDKTHHGIIPVVPSILPWFGNFFAFRHDPGRFMRSCRQQYGPVYKLLLAGQRTIVISHQKGIALLNSDTTRSLRSEPVEKRILEAAIGVRENQEYLLEVMHQKLFSSLIRSLSPASMTPIADNIQQNILTELRAIGTAKTTTIMQLDLLISRPLYRAGCLTLFGPTFPLNSFDDFHLFDSKFFQLIMGLPFVAKDAILARQRIITTFEIYIAPLWAGEEIEGISDVITAMVQEMRGLVTLHEAACLMTLFTFGFHTNTSNMSFWLLAHIIHQDLSAQLRQELYEAQMNGGSTPLMDSAVTEVLRWGTTNTTARVATEDTTILVDEKSVFIRKGDFVVADVESLHYDPMVYSNPSDFVIDRFVDHGPGGQSLQPAAFGGGAHLCPGRHLAKSEMKHFMTTLLQMYEIKATPSGKRRLPCVDRRGLAGPLRSSEVIFVELSCLEK
ncbi:cytochrome P450 [Crepidotus variabilis]|uniref:Cytochrome P450 n=1 Tax=Crepidotus variabilis TaxID=179855 RepID=A0A9P6E5Q9_9AGAR|nr:cytochrome P450 [Crepidotus variabilis]